MRPTTSGTMTMVAIRAPRAHAGRRDCTAKRLCSGPAMGAEIRPWASVEEDAEAHVRGRTRLRVERLDYGLGVGRARANRPDPGRDDQNGEPRAERRHDVVRGEAQIAEAVDARGCRGL